MKLILMLMITFSSNVFASYSCQCELEFQRNNTGDLYTEEVSVDCPETEDSSVLDCDGDEFGGVLTTTCINTVTDEEESNLGWTQYDAEPTTPLPDCWIW